MHWCALGVHTLRRASSTSHVAQEGGPGMSALAPLLGVKRTSASLLIYGTRPNQAPPSNGQGQYLQTLTRDGKLTNNLQPMVKYDKT